MYGDLGERWFMKIQPPHIVAIFYCLCGTVVAFILCQKGSNFDKIFNKMCALFSEQNI